MSDRQQQIYRGWVVHQRLTPTQHTFRYQFTFFGLWLESLKSANVRSPLRINRTGILAIDESDYLDKSGSGVADQILAILGLDQTYAVKTITSPKYLGYAFNPVTFHLVFPEGSDELEGAVAEVNNTFGDACIYPLRTLQKSGPNEWTATCAKEMHVSPFNCVAGNYHFTFRVEDPSIHIGVDLERGSELIMKTWIRGKAHPLTIRKLVRYVVLRPFDTVLNVMPRILFQAAHLYVKGLPVFKRPADPQTLPLDDDAPDIDYGVVV